MDCGADGMAGTGAFSSGQAFCRRPHFTDADHIRVLAKDPLQQEVLVDVQGWIFTGPGEQMDYGIQNVSIFVPLDQIKFAAAFLNRDEAAVVRTWDNSHAMMVVLPEPVAPAMQTDTP